MISDTQTLDPNTSIREMCRLLRVSRATVYRRKNTSKPNAAVETNQPKHVLGEENIFLRDEIEKIVLKHHWYGYRRVQSNPLVSANSPKVLSCEQEGHSRESQARAARDAA